MCKSLFANQLLTKTFAYGAMLHSSEVLLVSTYFLFYQYLRNFFSPFFAFLALFLGIISDLSNGFFLYPKILSRIPHPRFGRDLFVGWSSLKCTLHTRKEFFGVQTFPFLISLLMFSVHSFPPLPHFFSVGKENSLNGGSQSHVCVPLKNA